jgi:hypothetical protein
MNYELEQTEASEAVSSGGDFYSHGFAAFAVANEKRFPHALRLERISIGNWSKRKTR